MKKYSCVIAEFSLFIVYFILNNNVINKTIINKIIPDGTGGSALKIFFTLFIY
jgi:hypothetical protein